MIQGYWYLIPHLVWRCKQFPQGCCHDLNHRLLKVVALRLLCFRIFPWFQSIRKKGTNGAYDKKQCVRASTVFSIVRITCQLLMIPVCSFGIFGMGRYVCVFWHLLDACLKHDLLAIACFTKKTWRKFMLGNFGTFHGKGFWLAMLSVWCLEIP